MSSKTMRKMPTVKIGVCYSSHNNCTFDILLEVGAELKVSLLSPLNSEYWTSTTLWQIIKL